MANGNSTMIPGVNTLLPTEQGNLQGGGPYPIPTADQVAQAQAQQQGQGQMPQPGQQPPPMPVAGGSGMQIPPPQPNQPAPLNQSMPPDQETAERKGRWDGFFNKIANEPGAASFLAQLGAGLMQPLGPQDTAMGQLGKATQGAIQGQQQLAQQQQREEMAQAESERANRRLNQQDKRIGLEEDRFEEMKRQFGIQQRNELWSAYLDKYGEDGDGDGGTGSSGMKRKDAFDQAQEILDGQLKRDSFNLSEEELAKKYSDGAYMDKLENIAARLAGDTSEEDRRQGIELTGQKLIDYGVDGIEGGESIDPNASYTLDTETVLGMIGRQQQRDTSQQQRDTSQPQGTQPQETPQQQESDTTETVTLSDGRTIERKTPMTLGDMVSGAAEGISNFFSRMKQARLDQREDIFQENAAIVFRKGLKDGEIYLSDDEIKAALPSLEGDARRAALELIGHSDGSSFQQDEQVRTPNQGTIQR